MPGEQTKEPTKNPGTSGAPLVSEDPAAQPVVRTVSASPADDASSPTVGTDPPSPDAYVEGMLPIFNQSLVGKVVAGRYKVLDKLGEGGMGIVYLAEHITIEKKVALKVLLQEYAAKADLKDRFLQEAKAAAKIGHENIVDITDFGTTPDGSVFFAMEYLDGVDLSLAIRKGGPMPWSRAKPILIQICRALGAAHSKGIIHRDMKPENIHLIEREGRADFAKVLDFGIAKMSMDQGEKRLTRTGMIFGTPEYMSPEQAQGNKPDHRVDIYAVGVIMYEMVTGAVPFKADTFMGILTKHIFEAPVPPNQTSDQVQIPGEVEAIILKALAKDRDDRFKSMTEMAASIAQASGRMTRPTGDQVAVAPRYVTPAGSGAPGKGQGAAATGPMGAIKTEGMTASMEIEGQGRGKLIIAIIAALVLAGVVSAVVAVKGGFLGGEKTLPADPVKKYAITVNSTPLGARIYLGSYDSAKKPLGTTPATIEMDQSDRKVALTLHLDGYKNRGITVTPNTRMEKDVELTKLALPPPAKPDARPLTAAVEPKPKRTPKRKPKRKPKPVVETKVEPKPKPEPKPQPIERDNDLMNPFGD
jgi:tRNA A-37 threonylcarbamoyl transferase component Bud32